jgi:hypothetical protein
MRPMDEIRLKQRSQIESFERERQTVMRLQRREFEERFSELSEAIAIFSKEYSEGKGEVWPKKRAEEVARAIKRLESTYIWKKGIERKQRD